MPHIDVKKFSYLPLKVSHFSKVYSTTHGKLKKLPCYLDFFRGVHPYSGDHVGLHSGLGGCIFSLRNTNTYLPSLLFMASITF